MDAPRDGLNNPYQLKYEYGLAGQLKKETYPSGRFVSYNYDAAERLATITASEPGRTYVSARTYGAHGGIESETLGNGAVQTIGYNNRLQVSTISLAKDGTRLQHYQYQYGTVNAETGAVDAAKNNGQVGRLDAYIGGTAAANKQWEQRYTYDSLGRLDIAREQRGDTGALAWRADYDYDRYGNRMQLAPEQSQNVNMPYIAVTSADFNAQTNRFTSGVTYDAAGQITVDGKFRGRQYQYDGNGRMKWSAYTDGTGVATSVYDGLGQRVETSAGGVTRQHVYDAFGRVVAEYVISGAPQTSSTYKVSYGMYDRQGSKRVVLNESGAVTARHDYYPFGEEIQAGTGMRTTGQFYGATDSVRQRYAQTERDEGSGLEHTPWRKLETLSGRWTSPDPYQGSMELRDPQSFNRYTYVQNDPINFVDPSGLCISRELGRLMGLTEEQLDFFPWIWCPSEGGRGGGRGGDIDNNRGGGGGFSQNPRLAPLPDKKQAAISNAFEALKQKLAGEISEKCQKNVIDKLAANFKDFSLESFRAYLGQGANFYDGTRSQAPYAGTVTTQAAANARGFGTSTIADTFRSRPGTRAETSVISSTLTVFFRPGAISTSNNGVNGRNQSLLFHEALHGYGGSLGGTSYFDDQLQGAFGIKVDPNNTKNISDYIKKNCF